MRDAALLSLFVFALFLLAWMSWRSKPGGIGNRRAPFDQEED